jgi:hypothetical protein
LISTHDPSAFPVSLEYALSGERLSTHFLLRAVLVRDAIHKQFVLMAGVMCPVKNAPSVDTAWRYPDAVLISETMTAAAAVSFLQKAAAGELTVGDQKLTFEPPQGCHVTRASVGNYWMEQAGTVHDIRIHSQVNIATQERLVAIGAPYYPDAYEAARDWLGLREYNGSSDASHGHLLALIPESRAFIADAQWSDDDLTVAIQGSMANEPGLTVIGGYWEEKILHQLSSPVIAGLAKFSLPQTAQRLDLLVVGPHDEILDFHSEDLAFGGVGRRILGARVERNADSALLKEIYAGEGVRTEFKESLELSDEKRPAGERDKLAEVLRTVAAFSNTGGGTIYFGVSDAIEIVGTGEGVSKWAKGPADDAAIEGYMGALRAEVHNFAYPAVAIRTRAVRHQGKLIIALAVERANRPVCLMNDKMTYTRVGSNNVKTAAADLAPAQNSPIPF